MGVAMKTQISLVAWDPDSPEHVERLYQQRVACGWNKQAVESWRQLQREGMMAIQWVILADAEATREAKLAEHVKAWPLEMEPISDTALSLGGKPRTPSPEKTFIPVGHISLDAGSHPEEPFEADSYRISTFYISSALQGAGLGNAAMDAVESMAINEPLNAKILWLCTISNTQEEQPGKWEALGRKPGTLSRQDWYARRGYDAYRYKNRAWSTPDSTGREWWSDAVFMKNTLLKQSTLPS